MEEAFENRIPPADGRWRIYFGEHDSGHDAPEYASRCISWLLGVSLGRWAYQPETENIVLDEELILAAPARCAPGQLRNKQGLPAQAGDVPASYPIPVAWGGILVDDRNHPLDLERSTRQVIEIIWSAKEVAPTADAIEREASDILGVRSLRDYFLKPTGFFADHLKRYSKSRRQAPIYWQLSAGSGSYSVWLYYHRLTQDTLGGIDALGEFGLLDGVVKNGKVVVDREGAAMLTQP
jgi:hypothetical protein